MLVLLITVTTVFSAAQSKAGDSACFPNDAAKKLLVDLEFLNQDLIHKKTVLEAIKKQKKELILVNEDLSRLAIQYEVSLSSLQSKNVKLEDKFNAANDRAESWKTENSNCNKELARCLKRPWWKFHLPSLTAGGLGVLLLVVF